jgi:uncharacterized protein YndB with AHSA1/START domain
VITVSMSTVIAADRRRVWSALTRPDEITAWSPLRTRALAVPESHPKPGRPARWRFRLRGVPVAFVERPLEVLPAERLRAELRLSLVRVEETWSLADEAGGRTRLSLKLALPNSIPLVGGLVDRFGVRQLAQQMIDASLRALKEWIEASERSERAARRSRAESTRPPSKRAQRARSEPKASEGEPRPAGPRS